MNAVSQAEPRQRPHIRLLEPQDVFASIASISESVTATILDPWYNRGIAPADRLHLQNAFDAYLVYELTPFVKNRTSWPQMGTTGCSFGGYHAINFALRHPDIVTYAVSMSGAFDVPKRFLDGYYDQNAYFHSPLDYLAGLNEGWFLDQYRRNYYVLVVGNGDSLFDSNVKLAHEFGVKHVPHLLDVWEGFGHDWPWWRKMLPYYLGKLF